jgi:hypothetical protein
MVISGIVFMNTNRRSFLRNSAVLTAGSALLPAWTNASAATAIATRTLNPALALTADEQTVLAWVASYADSYRLQGGCILGHLRNSPNKFTQIVAHMADPAKFARLLSTKSPLSSALVNGDNYSFQYGQTLFTLQNSSTGLPSAPNPDWAHQALQYDPKTHFLTDPLGATGTAAQINYTIRLVAKTRTVPQNFQALVTGLVDSSLYKLAQDSAFNTFRNSVLNSKPANAADAAAVNRIFLQNLALLAQVFPANSLDPILQLPLVTASLATQFTVTSAQLVARFSALRTKVNRSYSDETIWLALLIPNQKSPQSGDLGNALCLPANGGFNAILSLDALADMRQLLNDPAFATA